MKSIEITDDLYERLEFVAACQERNVEITADEAIRAYVELIEPIYGVRYGEEKK